jgi:ubiquinone/menaquinone biosynthesis C-methylase UbiE
MAETTAPDDHKRQVRANFNTLATTYDTLRYVQRCARRLVELAVLPTGARVLDVATGTGWAAMPAAPLVGPTGTVVGVDLSPEMLEYARQKVAAAGLTNVELREGDAERLDFPDQSFDVVLCASSLFHMPNMHAALREWWRVLKPGGHVGFSGFGPTFLQPLRDLWNTRLRQYGATLPPSPMTKRLADPQTCRQVLHEASFAQIVVHSEQLGYYLQTTEQWWEESWTSPMRMPVLQLAPALQAQFKDEHLAEVAALATAQGLWVDVAVNFAGGWKRAEP